MQKNNLIVESLYRTVNTAAQKKKLTESTDIIKEYKIGIVYQPEYEYTILSVLEDADGNFWWSDDDGRSSKTSFSSIEDAIKNYIKEYKWDIIRTDFVDEYAYLNYDYRFKESLAEARNPENDEINAAIRRYLSSNKAYIPKKDQELFAKYDIHPGKTFPWRGSSKNPRAVWGKGGGSGYGEKISANTLPNHPDYDIANKLTKKKLGGDDIEKPTNDIKYYNAGGKRDTINPKDTSKMSWNQFDALQPYHDVKADVLSTNNNIKRAKEREAERINQIKQDTQSTIDWNQSYKDKAMAYAKAKHADKKKNESLLKESQIPLTHDDVYDLISDVEYEVREAIQNIFDTYETTVGWGDVDPLIQQFVSDFVDVFIS